MIPADLPADESRRLATLRELEVLDTASEERFDRLSRLASHVAGTPIALVTLIDEQRQWFKSRVGLDIRETPRDISFCSHAILGDEILEVSDTTQDQRFSGNPLVKNDPNIRFYAGVPLTANTGHKVGTLCVLDHVARSLTEEQQSLLRDIGNAVNHELELTDLVERARVQIREGEQLRSTLETVGDGIVIIDSEGVIQKINPGGERLFGYEAGELIGENVRLLMPEPDRGRHDDYINRYLDSGSARVIGKGRNLTGLHKDGTEIPIHLAISDMSYNGDTYFTGVIRDMSAEFSLRSQLEDSLEFRQAVLESASAAIISTTPEGVIQSFNKAAEELLGYEANELIGRQHLSALHDSSEMTHRANLLTEQLGRQVAPGIDVLTVQAHLDDVEEREWTYINKAGNQFPVELGISTLRGSSGATEGLLAVAIDISGRKQAEKAKSEFVSTVSHELRTPLTSIRGALGLLRSKFSEEIPDKGLDLLQNASRNSERLNLLVNDILDIEKLDAERIEFEFKAGDLGEAVEHAISSHETYAKGFNVDIALQDSPRHAAAYFDGHRVQQVLSNFLSNAVKYSPEGATVDVAISDKITDWRVSVRDKGQGIPESFRDKVFERFSQVDKSDSRDKGGTGLGLSISRAIVEQHDGQIGYHSPDGGGTEFFFSLPKSTGGEAGEATDACFREYPRILVCTHNTAVGDALCHLLSHNRLHGDQCKPEEGRQMLAQRDYQALLLDLSQGFEGSLDLLADIRLNDLRWDLPVIVLSSQSKPESVESRLQALNVYHWLRKPVDWQQLKRALNVAAEKKSHLPDLLHVEDDMDVVQIVKSVSEDLAEYDYAGSLAEARYKLGVHNYDVVLLDLTLPDGNGRDLLPIIAPPTRVIVFSGDEMAIPEEGEVIASLVKSQVTNESLMATLSQAL